MVKHTTINLDVDLVDRAREALGTTQVTETIHRALEEVVLARRRAWLASHDFEGLTPAALETMRKPRTFRARRGAR
jgi:Arc/MetJ family transcription regulator